MKNRLEGKVGLMSSIINKSKYVFLLASIPFLSSCATYLYKPTNIPHKRPAQEISIFDYEKKPINVNINLKEKGSLYDIYAVNFPSLMQTNKENNTVRTFYYKQKKEGKSAAIVVFPTMGGNYFISKYFAQHYAKDGFAVLRFERKAELIDKDSEDLDKLLSHSKTIFQQTVIDARRGLDWLEQQPEIDKNKIGLSGSSLGAVIGSLLLESDSRFKAGVLMLGGGNLAEILLETQERGLKKARKRIYKELNTTPEEFKKKMKEYLTDVDPLTYAKFVDPSKVLMINSVHDVVVPFKCSEELWKEMGRPEMIKLPAGHSSAIIFLPYAQEKAEIHFRKILDYKFKHPEPEPDDNR